MSESELKARIKHLEDQLAKKNELGLIVKRSDKSDGIMVLGLRKFPITFYADEWEALFSNAEKIRACGATPSKAPAPKAQAVG